MNEELKSCPFCGGSIKMWDTSFGVVRVFECKKCKIRFVFPSNLDGAELYEKWNRRIDNG